MKKFHLIIILLITAVIIIYADSYIYSGTRNTGNFLKIPVGARVEALGGAYIAVSDDIEGINSNPAGLALEDRFLIGATIGKHYLETDYNFFGIMIPTEYIGNISISAVYLNYGTQEEYDENGSLTGEFTCFDTAVTLTLSNTIFSGLYAGVNARYIETKLGDYSGGTFAGDIGILWNPKFYRNMFVGAVIRNFGLSMKVDEMANELSLIYGVGLGIYPVKHLNHRVLLSLDYEKAEDTPDIYKLGMEYLFFNTASLRLGMEISEFSEKELSYGIGLTRWNIGLNYSITSHESLD
ncbi:MAG TPA: PorV/PorQ family protein, partial [Firmicutes bacterium]|nr:PorV/PorQ family protein [Bacillota bacterium]